jgi:hypothetical protein
VQLAWGIGAAVRIRRYNTYPESSLRPTPAAPAASMRSPTARPSLRGTARASRPRPTRTTRTAGSLLLLPLPPPPMMILPRPWAASPRPARASAAPVPAATTMWAAVRTAATAGTVCTGRRPSYHPASFRARACGRWRSSWDSPRAQRFRDRRQSPLRSLDHRTRWCRIRPPRQCDGAFPDSTGRPPDSTGRRGRRGRGRRDGTPSIGGSPAALLPGQCRRRRTCRKTATAAAQRRAGTSSATTTLIQLLRPKKRMLPRRRRSPLPCAGWSGAGESRRRRSAPPTS